MAIAHVYRDLLPSGTRITQRRREKLSEYIPSVASLGTTYSPSKPPKSSALKLLSQIFFALGIGQAHWKMNCIGKRAVSLPVILRHVHPDFIFHTLPRPIHRPIRHRQTPWAGLY